MPAGERRPAVSAAAVTMLAGVVLAVTLALATALVVFPDRREFRNVSRRHAAPREIPLDFIIKLNEVEDDQEFFKQFLKKENTELINRFGGDERKGAVIPKPLGCKPVLMPVSLKHTSNPLLYHRPACTLLEQCGGCCNHPLLSCQPTDTEMVNFQIVEAEFTGEPIMEQRKVLVAVERHLKCKCDCVIKAENCTSEQVYRPDECLCACRNIDEEQKCIQENNTKLWDPSSCKCLCRDYIECSNGYEFSNNSCSCVPKRRAGVELRRRRGQTSEIRRVIPLPQDAYEH